MNNEIKLLFFYKQNNPNSSQYTFQTPAFAIKSENKYIIITGEYKGTNLDNSNYEYTTEKTTLKSPDQNSNWICCEIDKYPTDEKSMIRLINQMTRKK